jgi:hypothetical protein
VKRRRMKQIAMFEEPAAPKRASKPPPARRARMSRKAKKLSQYYTQRVEALRIAAFALKCVPDARTVLEPSAGKGALVATLLELCHELQITCVDIDVGNATHLLTHYPNVLVCRGDFLQFGTSQLFDVAVMNPPFENGSVAAHVGHALKVARNVICHCPLTTLAGQERREKLWSACELRNLAVCSTRPKYLDDGGKTDMCTIHVTPTEQLRDPSIWLPISVEMWP